MNIIKFTEPDAVGDIENAVSTGRHSGSEVRREQEGSRDMEQKIYKVMKGAGATNIVLGVIMLVVGIVSGILLIIAGAKLNAGKSKILF